MAPNFLPSGIQENPPEGPEEWIRTGKSIEDTQGPTTKDLRDDIVEAAVGLRAGIHDAAVPNLESMDGICVAVDAYHDALRKADREGKT